jgi:hypothetical protein
LIDVQKNNGKAKTDSMIRIKAQVFSLRLYKFKPFAKT